jgi:DAK2 domain fusion protein YloV
MAASRQVETESFSLDGAELLAMVSSATRLFEYNIEAINELNVFPVPDGDTGTNMFLTLRDVVKEAEGVTGRAASDVSAAMARGALMGARGNSGVILSQVFKALALEMEGQTDLDANHLAHALGRARTLAYKAVGQPVEGTLLTVIASAAEAAGLVAGGTVQEVLEAACDAARNAVALTPTKLKVLRDAGVVDAGGQGFLVLLEGARRHLADDEPVIGHVTVPEPIGVDVPVGLVSETFLDTTDKEVYGYCIQFLLEGAQLNPDTLRDRMAESADSAVVVGTEDILKVHVHAVEPDPVMDLARSLGTVSEATATNMDEQHRRFAAGRRSAAEGVDAQQEISVVAVAWGDGLEEVFRELGAASVLRPNGLSNPSVNDLVRLIETVESRSVIVLSNHPNVLPASDQAAGLSDGRAHLIRTKTMPQGVAAMLAFDDGRGVEDNVEAMERALAAVKTGEVCYAERAASLNGHSVVKGEVIGLLERELVAVGDDPSDVVVSLLRASEASNGDLVTVYWGEPVSAEAAASARDRVLSEFPGTEVELVRGGQSNYHYIISVE